TLREHYPDHSLDGYMRTLWTDLGKPEHYYTLDELEAGLARYSGDRAFAADFFNRFIRGHDVPVYEPLLAPAGLVMRRAAPGSPYLGNQQITYDAHGATITSVTTIGTPLYEAGLDRNDRIVTLDGRPLLADSVWA